MGTIDPFPHPRRGRASESLVQESTELAAVFVVLHVAATEKSILPRILDRQSQLPVKHAVDGEPVELRARDRRGRPVLSVSTFSPLRARRSLRFGGSTAKSEARSPR